MTRRQTWIADAQASQPAPTPNLATPLILPAQPSTPTGDFWAAVSTRLDVGEQQYGARLTANNGRNATVDLLQEIFDAGAYTAQAATEAPDARWGDVMDLLTQIAHTVQNIREDV